jgi:hypothetical protein
VRRNPKGLKTVKYRKKSPKVPDIFKTQKFVISSYCNERLARREWVTYQYTALQIVNSHDKFILNLEISTPKLKMRELE